MTNIKIDRLEIRLKDISPQVARSSVAGLGHELLKQLAKQHGLLRKKHAINISKIDSGAFRTSTGTSAFDLRRMIAGRISESITSKTKSYTQGGS
ncbi:MAG: hypothetical protein ACE5JP_00100 [Candidatus Bipolaricaulia bacterium]